MTEVINIRSGQEFDVYIGRPGPWGNPYSHLADTRALYRVFSAEAAIESYEEWVRYGTDEEARWVREHVHELQDLTLGCWCRPGRCHGDVLAKLAERGLEQAA